MASQDSASSAAKGATDGAAARAADTAFFGHPAGLSTLFFTEMWERFSYYGIRPLLLLFMTAALTRGGFGFATADAAAIVGIYAGSVYLLALPGGWLSDNWLGARRAVLWGAILIAFGHLAIGLSAILAKPAFFAGLILIPIGSGLMKPSISSMVGSLYARNDIRRDSGFSIFYMSVNIGGFVGALVTGFVGERIGWHLGFATAGVAMLIALAVYAARAPKALPGIGGPPVVAAARARRVKAVLAFIALLLASVYIAAVAGVFRPDAQVIAASLGGVLALVTVGYLSYVYFFSGFGAADRARLLVIFALFVAASLFWAALEQQPTSMNLFARDFTDRVILGFDVPVTWFQSLNPVYIVILSPLMALMWTTLRRRGAELFAPVQFTIALGLACIGFVVLGLGARAAQSGVMISPLWLLGSVLLQVVGELCLSPIGLNAFTQLAPEGWSSRMLGVFYMSSAIGNLAAGIAGGHIAAGHAADAVTLFDWTAGVLFGGMIVLGCLVLPLQRLLAANGVIVEAPVSADATAAPGL